MLKNISKNIVLMDVGISYLKKLKISNIFVIMYLS